MKPNTLYYLDKNLWKLQLKFAYLQQFVNSELGVLHLKPLWCGQSEVETFKNNEMIKVLVVKEKHC